MNFVNKITISVIVPFYNSENTFKCILSIIEQDNKSKFEIIMVDDGSTDHSLDIIKNFDNNNIKVFSLPENCGPAAARNLGLKKAKGDYVFFVDADVIELKKTLYLYYTELLVKPRLI